MKKAVLICLTSLFLSCMQSQDVVSPTALLIMGVNVVDVRNGDIIEDRDIVIDSGLIKSISSKIKHPEHYSQIINGKGYYLLPGLAEMHAHIPSPPTTSTRTEETLFLYLSNGITTIRGMLGHPSHLELRRRALSGELLSPRIFTSSPSLNGNTVQTPDEARKKVTAYASAGYDFLKIHPGIRLEVFNSLVETARQEKIPFAGHVPVDVGIHKAIESRYATIDHIDGFLEGLVPPDRITDTGENGFFGYNFTALVDTARIPKLVELSKQNKVWIVPTQSLFERWFAPTTADEMLAQPEMKYMPKATLQNWGERKIQATGDQSGFDKTSWEEFINIRRKLMVEIQHNGQGLLLGSDAPQIFNVPGFSIHREIEAMVRAGLSTLEILQSGTINVARYLDMEDRIGEIKTGLEADALMISGNPLEDLDALKEVQGILVRGKWISKEEIDRRLDEIEANARK